VKKREGVPLTVGGGKKCEGEKSQSGKPCTPEGERETYRRGPDRLGREVPEERRTIRGLEKKKRGETVPTARGNTTTKRGGKTPNLQKNMCEIKKQGVPPTDGTEDSQTAKRR